MHRTVSEGQTFQFRASSAYAFQHVYDSLFRAVSHLVPSYGVVNQWILVTDHVHIKVGHNCRAVLTRKQGSIRLCSSDQFQVHTKQPTSERYCLHIFDRRYLIGLCCRPIYGNLHFRAARVRAVAAEPQPQRLGAAEL